MRKKKSGLSRLLGIVIKVLLGILALLVVLMVIGMTHPAPEPEPTHAPTAEPTANTSYEEWLRDVSRVFTNVSHEYAIDEVRVEGDFAFVTLSWLADSTEKMSVYAKDIANQTNAERSEIRALKETWKHQDGSTFFGFERDGQEMKLTDSYEMK